MNDDRFFDLALKVIAGHCSDPERAELDALFKRRPELKAEFERLQADVGLAREVLPLVNATEATAPELPAYARKRLQTKVRQTLGRPQAAVGADREEGIGMLWRWRWLLGLAAATAVVVWVLLPMFSRPGAPVVQVAMLDTAGATRGGDTNELAVLRQAWSAAAVNSFSTRADLSAWEGAWPASAKGAAVKIVYDRAAGEVRVLGRWRGKAFDRTFLVEQDLGVTLNQIKAFIHEQTL